MSNKLKHTLRSAIGLRSLSMGLLVMLLSLSSLAQSLEIHHFDVGQGDATLFIAKDSTGKVSKSVLIDGGRYAKNGQAILNYLKAISLNKIDYVIASHYDADHTGGLITVLRAALDSAWLTVDKVYDRGLVTYRKPRKSPVYKQTASEFGVNHLTAIPGWQAKLYDDAKDAFDINMTCLAVNGSILLTNDTQASVVPDEMTDPDENDLSTAFVFTYGKFKYLTGGDIGGKNGSQPGSCDGSYGCKFLDIETQVMTTAGAVSAYKINHHGSRCSTNTNWVSATSAVVAFLSSGKHGTYKHPRQEVLSDLNNSPVLEKVYMTATENYYSRDLGSKVTLNTGEAFAIILTVNKTNKDKKNEDKTIAQKSIFYVDGTKYQEPDPPAAPVLSGSLND